MEQQPWRALLGKILAHTQTRAELANALGVSGITLTRWVNGETIPRLQNLRTLLQFLPAEYKSQMAELLTQAFPDFSVAAQDIENELAAKIPTDFYASVLEAVATTRKEQRFFTVGNRILTQMLGQLDPNTLGMAVSIALCMPAVPGQGVRSLREALGRGTSPWQSTLAQDALFLGSESLAGYALTKGRTITAPSKAEAIGFYTVRWEVWEESAIASPIYFENRLAGSLLVSSTQPNFFLPFRQTLVERYARLLLLALNPEQFYDQQEIQLRPMPPRTIQQANAVNLRQRLSHIILEATRKGQTVSIEEVEQRVWQQVEGELLAMILLSDESESTHRAYREGVSREY